MIGSKGIECMIFVKVSIFLKLERFERKTHLPFFSFPPFPPKHIRVAPLSFLFALFLSSPFPFVFFFFFLQNYNPNIVFMN